MSRAWMPLYVGDYRRGTSHLTTLEHGAYLLLIMHYWDTGRPLPNDDKRLAKIAGLTRHQWLGMRSQIFAFFLTEHSTNTLRHKRIDCELEKAEILFLKRSLAGQKGGQHKRGKTNFHRAQVEAMRNQPQPHKNLSFLWEASRLRKKAESDEG